MVCTALRSSRDLILFSALQGSVVSAIGDTINSVILAIAELIMAIVGGITSVRSDPDCHHPACTYFVSRSS